MASPTSTTTPTVGTATADHLTPRTAPGPWSAVWTTGRISVVVWMASRRVSSSAPGLPTAWAVAVGVGAPAMAFIGVALGAVVSRSSSRRQQALEMFRWAVEKALSDDGPTADAGWSVLAALGHARMLRRREHAFLDAVTRDELEATMEAIDQTAGAIIELDSVDGE